MSRLFRMPFSVWKQHWRYYGYSDRNPTEWHMAVSKDPGKSCFKIDYPFVKPYYVDPACLEVGLTTGIMDGHPIRIYDKDRVLCDCLRYRNKMDKEIFNKAVQRYIADLKKHSAAVEYAWKY